MPLTGDTTAHLDWPRALSPQKTPAASRVTDNTLPAKEDPTAQPVED